MELQPEVNTNKKESYNFLQSQFFLFLLLFIAKACFMRYMIFGEISLKNLFLSDILLVMPLFLVFEMTLKQRKFIAYMIFNFIASITALAITMYNGYYSALPTYQSLMQLNQVGELGSSLKVIFKPVYVLYFTDIIGLLCFAKKFWKKNDILTFSKRKNLSLAAIVALFVATITPFSDGGYRIVNDKNRANRIGMVSYNFEKAIQNAEINAMAEGKINNTYIQKLANVQKTATKHYYGVAKGKNVIVVQLEAFQNFVIGLKVNGQPVTPNLNRLIADGTFYFPNYHQQISKGNTADAEFMTNTSILPYGDEVTSVAFGDRSLPSFPKLLKKYGYDSATFHTNVKTFYNREQFYQALGFHHVYDKAFFGEQKVLRFGDIDELLFSKAGPELKKLTANNKKLYANFITMSSHYPFTMPKDMQYLKLPSYLKGTMVGDYLQATNYADKALGTLIQTLKKDQLWDQSVLVLYGDHFGLNAATMEKTEMKNVSNLIGKTYDHTEMMNIPLLMRIPNVKGTTNFTYGGQTDLLPTVANLLGINLDKKNFIHFGSDLFNTTTHVIPERFYLPTGSFYYQNTLFTPGNGFEDGILENVETLKNLPLQQEDQQLFNNSTELLQLSDAYLKSLPVRDNP